MLCGVPTPIVPLLKKVCAVYPIPVYISLCGVPHPQWNSVRQILMTTWVRVQISTELSFQLSFRILSPLKNAARLKNFGYWHEWSVLKSVYFKNDRAIFTEQRFYLQVISAKCQDWPKALMSISWPGENIFPTSTPKILPSSDMHHIYGARFYSVKKPFWCLQEDLKKHIYFTLTFLWGLFHFLCYFQLRNNKDVSLCF